jgi:hypothetical protein
MTAREESFLVLEKSLTNRISRQWEQDINGTLNEIVRAVNEGRWQDAERLCDGLSMRNVAEKNKRYMEFIGMQAVLFGASRLTQGRVDRTMFTEPDAEVPEEVGVASQALSDGLSTEGSQDVCQWAMKLVAEEKAAQEEAAYANDSASTGDVQDIEDVRTLSERRKAATDTFIRKFRSSVKSNGEAYINITGSLHTSRLGGWGFLQEAKFRGITEYQVSEQLDSRTCPVCRTMHGRKFAVGPADTKLNNWLSVDNLQQMKSIAPWPKQSKSAIKELASMSGNDIAAKGWDTPPYHPLCRGILVENGTLAEKLPVPREVVPEVTDDALAAVAEISEEEFKKAVAFMDIDAADLEQLTAQVEVRFDGRVSSRMTKALGGDALNADVAAVLQSIDEATVMNGIGVTERAAIYQYTDTTYRRINKHLRGESKYGGADVYSDWLDRGLSKMPVYEGKVYRGMRVDNSLADELRERYIAGSIVEEKAFTSTSISAKIAGDFGSNTRFTTSVNFIIKAKGKRGNVVIPYSEFPDEYEVIFRKNTKFRVLTVDDDNSGLYIYLEEVT